MKGYKCFMSLKFGLQVLLESYYIFFMKEVTCSLWDKCNFVLIYSRNVFFAPINGPLVCATNKGSDQPAHMRSLIWAFASHLTIIWLLSYWPISICSYQLVYCETFYQINWQQPFLNESAEGRRMAVEIISWSISTKVWDWTGIELATPGSAVRHASVARHVTDCATWPGPRYSIFEKKRSIKRCTTRVLISLCFWPVWYTKTYTKQECVHETRMPLLMQNLYIFQKPKNDFLDEQRAITLEGMVWYWPSWDIMLLINVTQVS